MNKQVGLDKFNNSPDYSNGDLFVPFICPVCHRRAASHYMINEWNDVVPPEWRESVIHFDCLLAITKKQGKSTKFTFTDAPINNRRHEEEYNTPAWPAFYAVSQRDLLYDLIVMFDNEVYAQTWPFKLSPYKKTTWYPEYNKVDGRIITFRNEEEALAFTAPLLEAYKEKGYLMLYTNRALADFLNRGSST